MSDSLDLGGEGNAFPFEEIGDKVTGKIVSLEVQQQTDLDTGEVKTWQNGQPMTMVRVELQTRIKDSRTDDGVRSVYVRGSKKPESQSSMAAVLGAVKEATGTNQLQVGGTLTLEFIDEEAPKKRGWNGRKLYAAVYEAPSVDLDEEQDEPVRRPAKKATRRLADQPANDDQYEDEDEGPSHESANARPESLAPRKRTAARPIRDDTDAGDADDEDDAPAPAPRKRAGRRPVRDLEDDDAADALRV